MKIETFLDLCSGIGGGRLGLEQAGLRCIGYSDTSKLSVRTYSLMHNVEDEPYFCNLKNIKTEKLPKYDLMIAGFPCQTFSVIGRKDGFSDNRGQIIFHLARILEETQPPCFLFENVKGLVTHDKGNTIKIIINELNRVGYNVAYKVLTSLDYGVPQMRQRVYFVGIRKDIGKDIKEFQWPNEIEKPPLSDYLIDNKVASEERLEILKYYLNNPTNAGKYTVKDIQNMEGMIIDTRMNDLRIYDGKCPTLRAQRDGVLYVRNHTIYQLTGYEALLLQGFPKKYADKVKDKVSDRHLLMQAGNAMTVNVIKLLGEAIKTYIENNTKEEKNMANWEDFEVECTNYLNQKYGAYAKFSHKGGADSTVPDILVKTDQGSFYIEAKLAPAQCGQFVLLPDISSGTFEYSAKNVNHINSYAYKIMEHMNQAFDEYREAGTTGKDIVMPDDQDIFAGWIIDTYKEKGVQFFITNNQTILPIDRFKEYFEITAKYRIKRSGSDNVGKSRIQSVKDLIVHKYNVQDTHIDGNKLFVTSTKPYHNERFILGGYEYMFALRNREFEIRKLSNTYNANVIFSIKLKNGHSGISSTEFISVLKSFPHKI